MHSISSEENEKLVAELKGSFTNNAYKMSENIDKPTSMVGGGVKAFGGGKKPFRSPQMQQWLFGKIHIVVQKLHYLVHLR